MKSDLEMGLLKENNQVGSARGAFSSTYHVQDLWWIKSQQTLCITQYHSQESHFTTMSLT